MTVSNEAAREPSRTRSFWAGLGIAILTSLLTVWTTVVRDDGNGAGFFMVILAVAVGWFAAGLRPAGMARTMVGVAIMQILLGALIATAPVTARVLGGPAKALLFSGVFALLWLTSGACFRAGAKGGVP